MSNRSSIRFPYLGVTIGLVIGCLLIGVVQENDKRLRLQCEALGGTFNSNRGAAICFAPGITYPLKKG